MMSTTLNLRGPRGAGGASSTERRRGGGVNASLEPLGAAFFSGTIVAPVPFVLVSSTHVLMLAWW
jgi:hypothetical protein